MLFLPIPLDLGHLKVWEQHWFPWLIKISRDMGENIEDLLRLVFSFEVQLALVWDDASKQAHALVGIRVCRRGSELVGEIIWLTGRDMKAWRHLLPQLEQYLRDIGCAVIRPIHRPGWTPFLKENGFRVTHYFSEKSLWAAADQPRPPSRPRNRARPGQVSSPT